MKWWSLITGRPTVLLMPLLAYFRNSTFFEMPQIWDPLADEMPDLVFEGPEGEGSQFKYQLHALPNEIGNQIGTSTLLAAWNAAVYVAQVDDLQLTEALERGDYLDATREVLQTHGGLWFLDETFVVSRALPSS